MNAFVNVARPMMAFAEPLEAERVPYPASPVANEEISVEIPETFTLWDTI